MESQSALRTLTGETRTPGRLRRRGLTMLELVVVLVVIALLTTAGLVSYRKVIDRTQVETARATLSAILIEARALKTLSPAPNYSWEDAIRDATADMGGPFAAEASTRPGSPRSGARSPTGRPSSPNGRTGAPSPGQVPASTGRSSTSARPNGSRR